MQGQKWTPQQRRKFKRTMQKRKLALAADARRDEADRQDEIDRENDDHLEVPRTVRRAAIRSNGGAGVARKMRIREMEQEIQELKLARQSAAERLEAADKQTQSYFPAAWTAMVNLFDSMSPHNKRGIIRELVGRV